AAGHLRATDPAGAVRAHAPRAAGEERARPGRRGGRDRRGPHRARRADHPRRAGPPGRGSGLGHLDLLPRAEETRPRSAAGPGPPTPDRPRPRGGALTIEAPPPPRPSAGAGEAGRGSAVHLDRRRPSRGFAAVDPAGSPTPSQPPPSRTPGEEPSSAALPPPPVKSSAADWIARAAIVAAVVLASYWKLVDCETYMRLAIGRFAAQTGLAGLHGPDPFLYSVPGLRWRNPEWLGDLLLWNTWRVG